MWFYHVVTCPRDALGIAAKSLDPDQNAPSGAVWSGSTLFAQTCLSIRIITVNELIFFFLNVTYVAWQEISFSWTWYIARRLFHNLQVNLIHKRDVSHKKDKHAIQKHEQDSDMCLWRYAFCRLALFLVKSSCRRAHSIASFMGRDQNWYHTLSCFTI